MDKKHILELARANQEDEGILQVNNKANSKAIIFTSIFILILVLFRFYSHNYAYDLFAIVPFMNAVHRFFIYKQRSIKIALIVSLLYMTITIISLYLYFSIQIVN